MVSPEELAGKKIEKSGFGFAAADELHREVQYKVPIPIETLFILANTVGVAVLVRERMHSRRARLCEVNASPESAG